jgi:hypothetical protein
MTPYVMTWLPFVNNVPVDRQVILNALNTVNGVLNWRASVGAVFIISNSTATVLSAQIQQKIPGLHHVIVPVDMTVTNGWADKETWEFLQRPRGAGMP